MLDTGVFRYQWILCWTEQFNDILAVMITAILKKKRQDRKFDNVKGMQKII